MKKRFFRVLIALALCSSVFPSAMAADGHVCPHGYHTFGDYTLNGGVGNYGSANRYYWIDASAFSSSQISSIISAAQTWVYTSSAIGVTTPISIERTTTQSSSVFDVYKKYLGVNTLGQTEFWTYSTHHALTNGALFTNYGYTKIYINTYESSMTGKQLQSTIAHEFGHAFGLSHRQTVPSSIMCQTKYGRTAIRASASDLQTINHLYA